MKSIWHLVSLSLVSTIIGCSGAEGSYPGAGSDTEWEVSDAELSNAPVADVTLESESAESSTCSLTACGGNPVGDWLLVSACVASTLGTQAPASLASCPDAAIQEGYWPKGKLRLSADGRFESHIEGSRELVWMLPETCASSADECRDFSSDALRCEQHDDLCRCEQESAPDDEFVARGRWALAADGTLRLTADGHTQITEYCSQNDTLNLDLDFGRLTMMREQR